MLYPANRTSLTFAWLMAVYPASAFAEVSDKEPTAGLFWAVGLIGAFLCILLTLARPSLGIVALLLVSLWFVSLFFEIHSSNINAYLQQEQGSIYYLQAYAAFILAIFGSAFGYRWSKRNFS